MSVCVSVHLSFVLFKLVQPIYTIKNTYTMTFNGIGSSANQA